MATCPNCDAEFSGRYCSNCGQRAVAHLRPTLHDLSHEAFHEFSHVDNKIIRTLKLLLFKPGMLTREFFEGKRARSVSPIRLYLLASVLFFGVIALQPSNLHVSVRKADAQMERAAQKINAHPEILGDALAHAFPKVMFILMPLFALVVFALYCRSEPLYVPHLYFAVHYHAYAFIILALFEAMAFIPMRFKYIPRIAMILWVIVYLAIALRRVYGGTRGVTALKTTAIVSVYLVLVVLAMAAIAFVTMRRLG